jgi:hypothetical protein
MNWFKRIIQAQKPMALPVYPPGRYYNDKQPDGAIKIDNLMEEETAQQERDQFPNMQWLGSGGFGVAVESNPNEVVKYTSDDMEVQRVSWAYRNKPDWVVPFLAPPRYIQEDPPLWALRMKKIELLNSEEQQLISALTLAAEDDFGRLPSLLDVVQNLEVDLTEEEVTNLYHQINYIIKQNINSLELDDLHGGNIGRDQGKLKVFDLGVGGFPSSPFSS